MRDRSSIHYGMNEMTGNRSRTCGSVKEGVGVAHVENRVGQSEERTHESWRSHGGTGATPEVKNGVRGNRYWADDATADTSSRSKNHESEESTNCCVGTFRQGRQVKVLDFVR